MGIRNLCGALAAIALLAGVPLAGPAAAQAPAAAPLPTRGTETVLYTVVLEDLEAAVRARGMVSERKRLSDGKTYLIVDANAAGLATGGNFSITPTVCDKQGAPPGCLGIQFRRILAIGAGARGRYERAAADFQQRYFLGRCYFFEDRFVFDHYAFTDGGVTRKHLESLVLEYSAIIVEFDKVFDKTT
jgi:hypothetical protein